MRASLSLHLSLFRRQKAQISRALEGSSPAFKRYEARYRRRTRSFEAVLPASAVLAEALAADIVYVGDYHTLRSAQQSYLSLVQGAVEAGRRVVMALEVIEGRHQEALDAYLRGKKSERSFRREIGHEPQGPFDLWLGFQPLLRFAVERRLPVIGIDRRARGPRSLELRDAHAAECIARCARTPERPLVMVLMGQYHVAPCHLPKAVKAALGDERRRHLVIYQNCESLHWKLLREGGRGDAEAVRIRDGELCLFNASPVECQQSFLDYLEGEAGDEPLLDRSVAERFREMARLIAGLAGVSVEAALAHVEVTTSADPGLQRKLASRGAFTGSELTQLAQHILSREGCYVPRARLACLGARSLNHAAEEAAHFVRHVAIGDALERSRRSSDAFYARCIEEALGFFGSKLVNPRRRCHPLSAWAQTFEQHRGEARQIAAFVLAHKAAEAKSAAEAAKLVPLHQDRLFHAVSHALGYLLGDALYRAFDAERLTRAEVRALFRDPLAQPQEQYFALARAAEARAMHEAKAYGLAR